MERLLRVGQEFKSGETAMKKQIAGLVFLILAFVAISVAPPQHIAHAATMFQSQPPAPCATGLRVTFTTVGWACVGVQNAVTQQVTTAGTQLTTGTAQAQTAITIPNLPATAACDWSLNAAPVATWQTGIQGFTVVTANTVTFYLSNPTAGSITPAAAVVNIKCTQ